MCNDITTSAVTLNLPNERYAVKSTESQFPDDKEKLMDLYPELWKVRNDWFLFDLELNTIKKRNIFNAW